MKLEIARIKEVGKKNVAEFVRSETGSVGIKNAATIAAFAGVLALTQTSSEAVTHYDRDGYVTSVAI